MEITMKVQHAIAALALLAWAAIGRANDGITLAHYENLERLSLRSVSGDAVEKPGALDPVVLGFDALGKSFELRLEPNSRLLAAVPAEFRLSSGIPYTGSVDGAAGSWARILIRDGMPSGMIFDGQDVYALEVPGDSIVPVSQPIAFRLADVLIAPGALSCAGGATATDGASVYRSLTKSLGAVADQGPGAITELSVGVVADHLFTESKTDPNAAIMTRFNIVDGFYSQQLGVQITPNIDVFSAVDDPFGTTTDPTVLLNEVSDFRAASVTQQGYGLTHLYTGRDLDGTTAGLAWIDTLCRSRVGSGLSEGRASPTIDSLVAAHEIGHNFGAPHDGDPNEACASEPDNQYIMAPTVNSAFTQFSACSVGIMEQSVAAASCITPLPATDISVRFNEPSAALYLSNVARYTLDVFNNGTQVAPGVSVEVTLPTVVSYIDAAGAGASCSHVAGVVSCTIGDVAGGGVVTIALTADTIAVGSGSFDAAVTATADDRPNNNSDSVQLSVAPAVDLVILPPAAATILVDQSTTLVTTIDNISTMDATAVSLSVSLQAGLQANSASWSLGNCTVTTQQVDCQATLFDRQSSSSFSLNVTGTAAGNKDYAITLSSTEDDANLADNSYAGKVRVNSPGGSDGQGGGGIGGLTLAVLAVLAGLAVIRRGRPLRVRSR